MALSVRDQVGGGQGPAGSRRGSALTGVGLNHNERDPAGYSVGWYQPGRQELALLTARPGLGRPGGHYGVQHGDRITGYPLADR